MKVYIVLVHNYCANIDMVVKVFDNDNAARQFVHWFNETNGGMYEWGVANFFEKEVYSEF